MIAINMESSETKLLDLNLYYLRSFKISENSWNGGAEHTGKNLQQVLSLPIAAFTCKLFRYQKHEKLEKIQPRLLEKEKIEDNKK